MSVGIETRQLYCTTAEVHFGPWFASDEEGEEFLEFCFGTLGSDPRKFNEATLAGIYDLWTKRPLIEIKPESVARRITHESALAIVGEAREQISRGMRGEQMDKRPLARVVALAGLLVNDARKREGVGS